MFNFFKPRSTTGYLPTRTSDDFSKSYYQDRSPTSKSSSSFEKPEDQDSTHSLLPQSQSFTRHFSPNTRLGCTFFLLNLFILLISILLSIDAHRFMGKIKRNEGNALLKAMSYHAPILNKLDIPLIEVTVNGTLLNESGSIYRQPPSPEVDAAWLRISNVVPTAITKEDVIALGKDPDLVAHLPDPLFHLGPNAYATELDIFHQLHCLDTLRRSLIHTFEHYHPHSHTYAPNPNTTSILTRLIPRVLIEHDMHCIHILQQALTCNPSLEPVTLGWMRTQKHPFPDFSVTRKCVDFEGVVGWQRRERVSEVVWDGLRVPEGGKEGVISEELVRLSEEREGERRERMGRVKGQALDLEEHEEGGHGGHGGH